MALGNRGIGLITYARFTHDDGHQLLILREARDSLAAIDPSEIEASAEAGFASHLHSLQAFLENADLGVDVDWDRPSLGRSKREQTYRSWCLRQRLFINPLNDVWQRPLVAHDVTFLPPLSTPPGPGMPTIVGAFNNLKQEYATARLMLFEGLTQERPHFSDRGVRLINTLDYPSYGLGREQVKVAFRMAYSILDKIGFIVNEYFSLEIKPKDVSFRLLWFTNQNPKQGLRDDLAARPNLPLRGLYWISRDLFDAGSGLNTAAEPDARHLQLVRNHIEHRYLKVHDSEWAGPDDESSFTDRLAYSIRRDDLERKALRMLKLARAGLLHLVLAIRVEESRRKPASGAEKGLTLPMHLDNFDDRWKV
ncbi:MAG: hypothetical protein DHS20C15_03970 [Planctomycetota bacterium]|nr:MAG: hypothetical protein DHS20C15_03970 [Planctomycetota bacterium]